MPRFGVLLMGPAGVGKSTFSLALLRHLAAQKRTAHIVNLDPGAEDSTEERREGWMTDVRDLVTVKDVMTQMHLGPNGALIFCMEYLIKNIEWLDEELGETEDDFIIFDCPGQIELYNSHPALGQLTEHLSRTQGFHLCGIYMLDAQFIEDTPKFFAGALSAMSAMVALEITHINILSKMDLVHQSERDLERFYEIDPNLLRNNNGNPRRAKLTAAISGLLESFSMVSLIPLNVKDEDSVGNIVNIVDAAINYWDYAEVRERPEFEQHDDNEA